MISEKIGKKEVRELRSHLRNLTTSVLIFLQALDVEMAKPSDVERGRRIARLSNALDMANDQARYFGLGVNYRTDKKVVNNVRYCREGRRAWY